MKKHLLCFLCLALLGLGKSYSQLPTNGLVCYFPFSGNANDQTSYANNGTVYGATLTTDQFGNSNSAYSFNGTSSFISVPHIPAYNIGTGNFTLSAIIRKTTVPETYSDPIITKHNLATWHDTEFFLFINPGTGTPQFGLSNSDGVFERIDGKTNVCDGKFHSLCGIRNNGYILIYVDGILEGTAVSVINPDNDNPLNIGRSSYNNGSVFRFNGTIDEVRFYNRALNINEIQALSNISLVAGLVAYFPFTGNANDQSGYVNNGTVYGAMLSTDITGHANSAYSFDGITNYISVPHNPVYNMGTNNFSLSAVIRKTSVPATYSDPIITKHNLEVWHDAEYFLYINAGTGTAQFGLSTPDGVFERINGTTNVCDGMFHTICGVRNNGYINIYVDGILEGTASATINTDNSNPINIGRSAYNNGSVFHFNGTIDEVRIYNRALNTAEIQGLSNISLTSGLAAYYPFTGNANDQSGNGNNGTVYGAVLTTDQSGNSNSAYGFNGTTNYISVPHSPVFNVGNGNMTLSAVIRKTSIPATYSDPIITKHNLDVWHDTEFYLYINAGTGTAQFGLSTADGVFERVNGTTNVCDGNFHSICGVRKDGYIYVYVDGTLEGSVTSNINPDNLNPINIGRSSYNNGTVFHFNGTIDEVRIYTRALNTREIKSLSNISMVSGLVAYYPFTGNANDMSGNGNNGTVYGAVLTNDQPGNSNSAYSFNGSSSYISVPHNSLYNMGTGNFSISAVIRKTSIPETYSDPIITKHNLEVWHDTEFFLYINAGTGTAQFGLSTSNGVFERISGTKNVCDGNFHSICGIRKDGYIYIYVDGIPEGSVASSINPDNSNPVNIGRSSYNNGSVFHFNGTIDEVCIYNRALNPNEIKAAVYTGINRAKSEEDYLLFPNPATHEIQVTGSLKQEKFQVINFEGHIVKSGILNDNRINIEELPKGIYILKIGLKNLRFIKQ